MIRQLILFLSILLLSACTKILDLKVPEVADQIVVNCIFHPDTNFVVGLERSKGVLEPTVNTNRLPDATIELYGNGVLLETVQVDSFETEDIIVDFEVIEGIYDEPFPEPAYVRLQTRPIYGVDYRLKVSATGYETVEAVSSLPPPIPITQILLPDSTDEYGPDLEYSITLQDDGAIENYYFLRTKEVGQRVALDEYGADSYDEEGNVITLDEVGSEPLRFWSQDIVFEDIEFALENFDPEVAGKAYFYHGFAPFSDESFNGQNKALTFTIPSYSSTYLLSSTSIIVDIGSASKEFFDYYRSVELQYNADGAAFAEPVTINSNVSNGLGIFAGYTSHEIVLTYFSR